jgi:hypothetical protein
VAGSTQPLACLMRHKTLFALMLFALGVSLSHSVRSQVVARFGGECHGDSFNSSPRLRRLISESAERASLFAKLPDGEAAFTYDLNGDGHNEYFVRLACGGTGNCDWGIFSTQPARLRGVISAWFFYVHKRLGSWSGLSTYTRMGGDDGTIDRFAYHRGKYVRVSTRVEQGHPGNWQPFLKRMGLPKCADSGR